MTIEELIAENTALRKQLVEQQARVAALEETLASVVEVAKDTPGLRAALAVPETV